MTGKDKPRIRLHVWYDCGWKYEHWECRRRGTTSRIGRTPKEAYMNWLYFNRLANA